MSSSGVLAAAMSSTGACSDLWMLQLAWVGVPNADFYAPTAAISVDDACPAVAAVGAQCMYFSATERWAASVHNGTSSSQPRFAAPASEAESTAASAAWVPTACC